MNPEYNNETLREASMKIWNSRVGREVAKELKKYNRGKNLDENQIKSLLAYSISEKLYDGKMITSLNDNKNYDDFDEIYFAKPQSIEPSKPSDKVLEGSIEQNVAQNDNKQFADSNTDTRYEYIKTPCVGSYEVSGYTKKDGTEVDDYIRTCGAKHIRKVKKKSAADNYMDKNVTVQQPSEQAVPSVKNNDIGYKQIKNPDGSYKLEMGIAEQSLKKNIHNFMHDHFKIYRDYENLDFISGLQKAIAIGLSTPNNKNIYREYYQIALNFADNNLESNKNDYNNTFTMFQYYKNNDIKNFFKSIIIKSENLNINDAFYNYTINHTMIVTAKDNSPLKNKILKSDTLRSFISNNYNVIKKGKLQGKSISIEFPYDKSDYDKISLYLTLHNALIYNPHIDEKGNLSMDIADYYDFEKLPSSEDLLKNIFIDINNRAYEQQLMGKLKPYILHIHITIPANDLNTIINHTK